MSRVHTVIGSDSGDGGAFFLRATFFGSGNAREGTS